MNVVIIEKSVAQQDAAMNIITAALQNEGRDGKKLFKMTAIKGSFLFVCEMLCKAVCKEIHIEH